MFAFAFTFPNNVFKLRIISVKVVDVQLRTATPARLSEDSRDSSVWTVCFCTNLKKPASISTALLSYLY